MDVSREIPGPTGKSLYDEWKISRQAELQESRPAADDELVDTRIGSGSDHTVFLNFLGIPVAGLTFAGPYGVYHSAYDDFYWMNHFGDPGYHAHTAMTRFWGTAGMRLADADILPFDFQFYGAKIRKFISSLDAETHLSAHVDLSPLKERAVEFETAGGELNQSIAAADAGGRLTAIAAASVNLQIMQVERNWCNPQGIPGRPWFNHTLYGTRETYAPLELPGLTEAAEAGDWKRAEEQETILEEELAKNSTLLHSIQENLDSLTGVANQ